MNRSKREMTPRRDAADFMADVFPPRVCEPAATVEEETITLASLKSQARANEVVGDVDAAKESWAEATRRFPNDDIAARELARYKSLLHRIAISSNAAKKK